MKTPRFLAGLTGALFCLCCCIPFAGCRDGAGSECLTDSDCEQDLVCLHGEKEVDGRAFPNKWGSCTEDPDQDGIGNDGDFTGSNVDNRCGVHVVAQEITGSETVFEKIIGDCDDNCTDVSNSIILTRFGCSAKDDCCPISDDDKRKAEVFHRCTDVSDEQDACEACISGATGGTPLPSTCFLDYTEGGGLDVDENGCIHCRPLQVVIPCVVGADKVDPCENDPRLPKPACSGRWACVEGTCSFTPKPFKDLDEKGQIVLYQLDKDWDGVGDQCDNCPDVPNGVECRNPTFAYRCDADGDGVTTPGEIERFGNQANNDKDQWGNACDLCPEVADNNNRDLDGDGSADPCDADDDGDRYCDPGERDWTCTGVDNCPEIPNEDQRNRDFDSFGDACDSDIDGDEIRQNGDGTRIEGDNPCNPETGPCCDNPPCPVHEGYLCRDCDDNCPLVPNPDQIDSDGDGTGDACE